MTAPALMAGLQTGIVKDVVDPQQEFRVLVSLPGNDIWARLASVYAANGAVFYPAVGDEVILGFIGGDPDDPVILGSLYGKQRPPPAAPEPGNDARSLVTRGKLELAFDDERKTVAIKTPGGQRVTLDDSGASVSLEDENGNAIVLSKNGIVLASTTGVTIIAEGNVTIAPKGSLNLEAGFNVSMRALEISQYAQGKFSAQGNAQAEVTTSGILTLHGALVKISDNQS
jgi:uncharacterized protein involved in type VI secretion and phage assembly